MQRRSAGSRCDEGDGDVKFSVHRNFVLASAVSLKAIKRGRRDEGDRLHILDPDLGFC